jgi:RNA polymerase sigma-70 factor (sigma-E family)
VEFERFIRDRGPDLLRFTSAVCADRALAEDVLQEVLIRLHPRWADIQAMGAPETYVRRCLVNEYLTWRRKWARIVPREVLPTVHAHQLDHADAHADRAVLMTELAALPPRQRAVLVMRFYGGHSDDEIADVLGCRPATVRGYASRALKALRIELDHQTDTYERSAHAYRA